jgi:hypothetical protein
VRSPVRTARARVPGGSANRRCHAPRGSAP